MGRRCLRYFPEDGDAAQLFGGRSRHARHVRCFGDVARDGDSSSPCGLDLREYLIELRLIAGSDRDRATPLAANRTAIPLPIPRPAPVTIAMWPLSSPQQQ